MERKRVSRRLFRNIADNPDQIRILLEDDFKENEEPEPPSKVIETLDIIEEEKNDAIPKDLIKIQKKSTSLKFIGRCRIIKDIDKLRSNDGCNKKVPSKEKMF